MKNEECRMKKKEKLLIRTLRSSLTTHHLPLFLLLAVALLLFAPQAFAHAALVSSEPEPGETVAALPPFLRLTFTDVLGEGSEVELLDVNFGRIPLSVQLSGQTMLADLPQLDAGVYTVQYDVESEDGHGVSGSYEFALEGEPQGVARNPIGFLLIAAFFTVMFVIVGRSKRQEYQRVSR